MNKIVQFSGKLGRIVSKSAKFNYPSIFYSTSTDNYITVYKFPYVLPISMINILKYYQTILTSVALPSSFLLTQLNVVSTDILKLVALIGITGCINLYSFGYFSNYLIGYIYYDVEKKLVKIAYVDFWGKRKEVVATTDDLKLQHKVGAKLSMFGTPLVKVSTDELFKINLRYGTVLHESINEILHCK